MLFQTIRKISQDDHLGWKVFPCLFLSLMIIISAGFTKCQLHNFLLTNILLIFGKLFRQKMSRFKDDDINFPIPLIL